MSNTKIRRKHTAEFKAKVALEAISERSTLSELSKRYDLHPNLIVQWKRSLTENVVHLFQESPSSKGKDEKDRLIDSLYHEVGSLTMDINFLKKKLNL